jgi:WD40 repeat protein
LAAGFLGVSFDALWGFEKRRRMARRLQTTIASVVATAGIVGIGSWQIRDRARGESLTLASISGRALDDAATLGQGTETSVRALRLAVLASRSTFLAPAAPEAEPALARAAETSGRIVGLFSYPGEVTSTTFSPDGTHVAVASGNGSVQVIDLSQCWGSDCPRVALSGHQGFVTSTTFSPDGKRLATTSVDKTARVWNLKACQKGKCPSLILTGYTGSVLSAAFSPDGKRLVTGAVEPPNFIRARVWDLTACQDGKCPVTVLTDVPHVAGTITVDDVAFSPDGTCVAAASNRGRATLWNLKACKGGKCHPIVLRGLRDRVNSVRFSHDGTRLVTASSNNLATDSGIAQVWNLAACQGGTCSARLLIGHRGSVYGAEFSLDGTRVVTRSYDQTARVWDANSGALLLTLGGHEAEVNFAQFSSDRRKVFTTSDASTSGTRTTRIRMWDVGDCKAANPLFKGNACRAVVLAHLQGEISSVAFSRDGNRVSRVINTDGIRSQYNNAVRVWDITIDAPITLRGQFIAAGFSDDGKRLVTVTGDGLQVWDADTAVELFTLNKKYIYSGEISADGSRVLLAEDRNSRIFDARSAVRARSPTELFTLKGHTGPVYMARFFHNDAWILTVSADNTIRTWDAHSGAQLRVVRAAGQLSGPIDFGQLSNGASRIVTSRFVLARAFRHWR